MNTIFVDCLEVILDEQNLETYVRAYAIGADGVLIEPDEFEELPDSTRCDGGVYRWRDTWLDLPGDALMFKITCLRTSEAWYDFIQKPDKPTKWQVMRLYAILDDFGLDQPEDMPCEAGGEDWSILGERASGERLDGGIYVTIEQHPICPYYQGPEAPTTCPEDEEECPFWNGEAGQCRFAILDEARAVLEAEEIVGRMLEPPESKDN